MSLPRISDNTESNRIIWWIVGAMFAILLTFGGMITSNVTNSQETILRTEIDQGNRITRLEVQVQNLNTQIQAEQTASRQRLQTP